MKNFKTFLIAFIFILTLSGIALGVYLGVKPDGANDSGTSQGVPSGDVGNTPNKPENPIIPDIPNVPVEPEIPAEPEIPVEPTEPENQFEKFYIIIDKEIQELFDLLILADPSLDLEKNQDEEVVTVVFTFSEEGDLFLAEMLYSDFTFSAMDNISTIHNFEIENSVLTIVYTIEI